MATNPTPTQQETLEPPETISKLFCPTCGQTVRSLKTRHYSRGSLCSGAPVAVTYTRAAVAGPRGDAEQAAKEIADCWARHVLPIKAAIHSNPTKQLEALALDVIQSYFPAPTDNQWRQGMKDAAKEVCDACSNEERYGPAQKIKGSTRWWHGDDNIPCEAGGIWYALAESSANNAAAPAANDVEG